MNLFKKNKDILTEKTEKLEALTKNANDAVELVSKTINNLKQVNSDIETTVAEIDEYCDKLYATREQLNKNHIHNTAIISNFSKLLCVTDDAESSN